MLFIFAVIFIVPGGAVVTVHVLMLRADFYVYSTTVRYISDNDDFLDMEI